MSSCIGRTIPAGKLVPPMIGDLFAGLKQLRLAEDGPWEPREALHVHGPARLPIRFDP